MGFSWALWLAQNAGESLCDVTPVLRDAHIWNDRSGPVVIYLSPRNFCDLFRFLYVDNAGCIGRCQAAVTQSLKNLVVTFQSDNLLVHERVDTDGPTDLLGVTLDPPALVTRPRVDRWWRIRQGIRHLLWRGRASGDALSAVLGHATFLALVRREALAVFEAVYPFCAVYRGKVGVLWWSVRRELECFLGVMFLLESSWTTPWNPLVLASDASLSGWAVAGSYWSRQDVATIGRVQERSRFRYTDMAAPREHALGSLGFSQDNDGKWHATGASGVWEQDSEFPEVPGHLLAGERWETLVAQEWFFYDEPINVLEARAAVKAIERIAYSKYGFRIRQLIIVDNMAVALCFNRHRARKHCMLRLVRRAAALELGCDMRVSVRWVPSEVNSSDGGSRVYGNVASKNLIAFLTPEPGDHRHYDSQSLSAHDQMEDAGQHDRSMSVDPANLYHQSSSSNAKTHHRSRSHFGSSSSSTVSAVTECSTHTEVPHGSAKGYGQAFKADPEQSSGEGRFSPHPSAFKAPPPGWASYHAHPAEGVEADPASEPCRIGASSRGRPRGDPEQREWVRVRDSRREKKDGSIGRAALERWHHLREQGRRSRKREGPHSSALPGSACPEVPGCHRGGPHHRCELPRKPVGGTSNIGSICPGSGRIFGMAADSRAQRLRRLLRSDHHRRLDSAVPREDVHGRPPRASGREVPGGVLLPLRAVQPLRELPPPAFLEVPQGVEEAFAGEIPAPGDPWVLDCRGDFDGHRTAAGHGSVRPHECQHLPSARAAHSAPEEELGPAGYPCDGILDSPGQCDRDRDSFQDRGHGRLHPVGLTLASLGEPAVGGSRGRQSVGSRVHLQLPTDVHRFSQGGEGPRPARHGAVPDPAQRPQHRRGSRRAVFAGGPKERAVEVHQVGPPIREVRETGGDVASAELRRPGLHAGVREEVRRGLPVRPRASVASLPSRLVTAQGRKRREVGAPLQPYLAVVSYEQIGLHIARAAHGKGYPSRFFSLWQKHSGDHGVTFKDKHGTRDTLSLLGQEIQSRRLLGLIIIVAVPTVAQPQTTQNEQCIRQSAVLLSQAVAATVPSALFGPMYSSFWSAGPLAAICHRATTILDFDWCRFGASWRHTSSVAFFNVPLYDLLAARQRRCSDRHVCSVTGKPHTTHRSDSIPFGLCALLARLLLAAERSFRLKI